MDTERVSEIQVAKPSESNNKSPQHVPRPVPVQKQTDIKTITKPLKTARTPDTQLMAANQKAVALQKPKSPPVIKNTPEASVATTHKTQSENKNGPAQQDIQAINKRIQEQLHTKILFNQYYPGIAVRNAWEGRVNLGMRVLANGKLTDIHVVNSSGYRILDSAAVKSVVRVATLPEARDWLQGREIDVILPVIYKLTDS